MRKTWFNLGSSYFKSLGFGLLRHRGIEEKVLRDRREGAEG